MVTIFRCVRFHMINWFLTKKNKIVTPLLIKKFMFVPVSLENIQNPKQEKCMNLVVNYLFLVLRHCMVNSYSGNSVQLSTVCLDFLSDFSSSQESGLQRINFISLNSSLNELCVRAIPR
jgi:hypothetical protein